VTNNLKVIYTPLHGTGLIPFQKAMAALNFTNYTVVAQQQAPDPNFSTVLSPNPENPDALKMAVDMMTATNSDLVLANDPDADRIGVAVNHQGKVFYLSGNQLGSLLLFYILKNTRPKQGFFLNTIVTTKLQDKIAASFNVKTYKTLTGFKWLAAKIRELEQNSTETFVFATEESFGFLNHTFIRDKDGISPLALIVEMASLLKKENKTLIDALWEIYQQYGHHHEELLNIEYTGKEGAEKILRIMQSFRNLPSPYIAGEKILKKIDYLQSNDLPPSNVLQFDFANTHLLLRPSGTEPKIKFYLLINEEGDLTLAYSNALQRAKKFINFIKDFTEKT
jgi:phosphoglucomutase